LHRAGLEVLIDVLFNHTAEGGQDGPTLCYRGLDNPAYYRLDPGDPSSYFDTTGCGNSLNVGNPVTLQLIMDTLRYWLTEMHVDGFRPLRMKTPATAAAPSAFKRFLQLAADFVGRGVHRALRDLGGTRKRLVESFFDGRLANHDEPCLVSSE